MTHPLRKKLIEVALPPEAITKDSARNPPVVSEHSADRGNAVIVSFDSKWQACITVGELRAVIRKQEPKPAPRWMYCYLKRPIGSIIARASIKRLLVVKAEEASEHAQALGMLAEEVRSYVGKRAACIYQITGIELTPRSVPVEWLRSTLAIHPPTTHMFLARGTQRQLDEYAGFEVME